MIDRRLRSAHYCIWMQLKIMDSERLFVHNVHKCPYSSIKHFVMRELVEDEMDQRISTASLAWWWHVRGCAGWQWWSWICHFMCVKSEWRWVKASVNIVHICAYCALIAERLHMFACPVATFFQILQVERMSTFYMFFFSRACVRLLNHKMLVMMQWISKVVAVQCRYFCILL